MVRVKNESLNRDLLNLYSDQININKYFIASTIFMCETITIIKVLDFIKKFNFRSYFLNNMYDTNLVNYYNSPPHFLERLFGIINL